MEILDDGRWALDTSLEATAVAYYAGVINDNMSQRVKVANMFRHGFSFVGSELASIHPLPANEGGLGENSFFGQSIKDFDGGYKDRQEKLTAVNINAEPVVPGKLVISEELAAKARFHLIAVYAKQQGKLARSQEPESMYDNEQLVSWMIGALAKAKQDRDGRSTSHEFDLQAA